MADRFTSRVPCTLAAGASASLAHSIVVGDVADDAAPEREHRVAARQHAEVAVTRFRRMQEEGGRAGGGEGRRDLLRDEAGLAHAGGDDAAAQA